MTANVALLGLVAVLYAAGVFLVLDRSLTRILLGLLMLGNATNVLLLVSGGPRGGAPIVGVTPNEDMSDPLAQAMILTAIVITLGLAAFVLALIHRSWTLAQEDAVVDDVEDRRIAGGVAPDDEDSADSTGDEGGDDSTAEDSSGDPAGAPA